jgi:hypothetical protein
MTWPLRMSVYKFINGCLELCGIDLSTERFVSGFGANALALSRQMLQRVHGI